MLYRKYLLLYFLNCFFLLIFTSVHGLIDPITGTFAIGAFVAGYFLHRQSNFDLPFSSSCPKAIDVNELKYDMDKKFFGQHIAARMILFALKGNSQRSNYNKKPLVMSFHGPSGCGKNFVADLIADNIFSSKKMKKSRYHLFHGHEYPKLSKLNQYKEELHSTVKSAIQACNINLFVFDEIHYMPMGMLDVLIPFLENHDLSVDSRQSIFIFLTNAGSNAITEKSLELWDNGYSREQMEIHDFDLILQKSVFNDIGGLKKSPIIDSHIIDNFIPFLPLEKNHVVQCIEAELKHLNKAIDPEIKREILQIIPFGPEPHKLFSTSGCKRINQLVTQYVTENMMI